MAKKDELGRRGEDLAVAWAQAQGWQVLARNWRGTGGELDLVARDGTCLVIAEVKTRRSVGRGHPVEAVTALKVRRLRQLAGEWARREEAGGDEADGSGRAWFDGMRIDVIGILWPVGSGPRVSHLRGVS